MQSRSQSAPRIPWPLSDRPRHVEGFGGFICIHPSHPWSNHLLVLRSNLAQSKWDPRGFWPIYSLQPGVPQSFSITQQKLPLGAGQIRHRLSKADSYPTYSEGMAMTAETKSARAVTKNFILGKIGYFGCCIGAWGSFERFGKEDSGVLWLAEGKRYLYRTTMD